MINTKRIIGQSKYPLGMFLLLDTKGFRWYKTSTGAIISNTGRTYQGQQLSFLNDSRMTTEVLQEYKPNV